MALEMNSSKQLQAEDTPIAGSSNLPRLVVVTPARNEAQFIELTLQSMIAQTVRPVRWIVVSDGSTDGTDDIVQKYAAVHSWIELLRMPERQERHFAGKVYAFRAAYEKLTDVSYDVIANIDGDISFESNYIEFLLTRFRQNPRLGVAGTPFQDDTTKYNFRIVGSQHVSGCCQFFRRECFEQIGGYMPIKTGGIDLLAVYSARMHGWETRSFFEMWCIHHRSMGSAKHGVLRGAYLGGRADYILGCDPLWQTLRSAYRMVTMRPYLLNGLLCLTGYTWAAIVRTKKAAPDDLVRFRRAEERGRLLGFIKKQPVLAQPSGSQQ